MHETMEWTQVGENTQTASPSAAFWEAWRADKDAVKANGYSVAKTGSVWSVTHRKVSTEASRSLESSLDVPVPAGLSLFNYQKAGIEFAYQKNALIADEPGTGKAQAHGTKVYTAAGPVNIEDIRVGDFVFGSGGAPTRVTGVFPQGFQDIYRVEFCDNTHLDVTLDHLWQVDHGEVLTVRQMMQRGLAGWKIPTLSSPVKFPERKTRMDPVSLVELLFKDERLITQRDLKNLAMFGMTPGTRRIPEEYRYNTEEVRRSLLTTFDIMRRYAGFLPPAILTDMLEMVRSLGMVVLPYQEGGYYTQLPDKIVSRISKLPGKKEATCISVAAPDSLYVAEDFIITHNTIQTAGVINMHPEYTDILVVVPNSLKLNWKRELEKWLVAPFSIGVVDRRDFPDDADIVIINYDMASYHHEKLRSREWSLLVIDEAHMISNPDAKRTKAILGKGKKIPGIPAKQKLFLTGTPILNRPIEMFTLLNSLDQEQWPNRWKYAHRYCAAKHNGYGWDFSGASNLAELNQKLRSSIMIRRTKAEALPELPPVFHQIIELPQATAEMKKLIREENKAWSSREEVLDTLRAAVEVAKVEENEEGYKNAISNLRTGMAATFADMAALRQKIAIEKIPYALEHLRDVEGKVVVFFHHKEVGRQLKEALGEEAVMLVGDTKTEDRQEAVDQFQNNPKIKYFLGSLSAAGVGITLTEASLCVLMELPWQPALVEQGYSRLQRIGQKSNVLVQYLLIQESLDVKMAHDIISKLSIVRAALDDVVDVPLPDTSNIHAPERNQPVEPVSDEEKASLLESLRHLAALDSDHARAANSVGFNRVDSKIGHSLSQVTRLSDRQAHLARRLVQKYRRQLDAALAQ